MGLWGKVKGWISDQLDFKKKIRNRIAKNTPDPALVVQKLYDIMVSGGEGSGLQGHAKRSGYARARWDIEFENNTYSLYRHPGTWFTGDDVLGNSLVKEFAMEDINSAAPYPDDYIRPPRAPQVGREKRVREYVAEDVKVNKQKYLSGQVYINDAGYVLTTVEPQAYYALSVDEADYREFYQLDELERMANNYTDTDYDF